MSERPGKGPKIVPAKNKTPAPIQITAEQLLREAKERQLEYVPPVSQAASDLRFNTRPPTSTSS